uniref:UTP23 sensor motif region domain-containing protein n=1 Tax=Auxenochlorella protothecoides TaxID=3075 RepID=A0A1D2A1Z8_AUXPR
MRRRKHKQVRRALRFYRIQHGFRAPFKVLADGNFINAVSVLRNGDPTELLSELLGDKVRVFTTPCVMHEVRKMGNELSKARDACRRLALHHCGHEETTKLPAAECLAQQIGGGNPNHFLVATQDRDLQQRIMSQPGGAVLFTSVHGVGMAMPSTLQKEGAAEQGSARLRPSAAEKRTLEGVGRPAGEDDGERRGPKTPFKRNKAKGPNPLACKPRKTKKAGAAAAAPEPAAAPPGSGAKRARVRRSRQPRSEEADE